MGIEVLRKGNGKLLVEGEEKSVTIWACAPEP